MKILEVEVTAEDDVICIRQPNGLSDKGVDEVYITMAQLSLFQSMLNEVSGQRDKE